MFAKESYMKRLKETERGSLAERWRKSIPEKRGNNLYSIKLLIASLDDW